MPPKLLDINVEIAPAVSPDVDVSDVNVLDAGADNPEERTTFVHFYAVALSVMLEMRLNSKR